MTVRRIFIVDDDDAVRTSLIHLLSIFPDSEVYGFSSGDAFLDAVGDLEAGCLLLDLQMPGMSGLQVLEAIRPIACHIVPIVLTGQGDVSAAVQAMKLGAFDFIEKPCDPNRLIEVIDQVLTQQAESSRAITRRELAKTKINMLSVRERDVLMGLMAGKANKAIAHDLGLSPRTVEIYRAKLMEKLNARSLPEALSIAFASGEYSES
jgi:two-component system response regulator FixJ